MAPPVQLPTRRLGKDGPLINKMGFGLMGLGVGYGFVGTDEERLAVLDRAWELGNTTWDTADAYGDCEDLVGKWFKLHPERRQDIFLATKFGLRIKFGEGGSYSVVMDSTPEYAREACEKSLARLGVDRIDLYYIHRLDEATPIEKTMQTMVQLKEEGKIKYMGISECSSTSLRRAYAVHPIHAVQVEYNPWDLDIEGEEGTYLLRTCRELGVTTFAYAPLGRGIMTGRFRSLDDFEPEDSRRNWPRFSKENFPKNMELVDEFKILAGKKGCAPGQLAIAWLMAQGEDIIPIPGTKHVKYLEENLGALKVDLSAAEEAEIRKKVDEVQPTGSRTVEGFLNVFADTPPL